MLTIKSFVMIKARFYYLSLNLYSPYLDNFDKQEKKQIKQGVLKRKRKVKKSREIPRVEQLSLTNPTALHAFVMLEQSFLNSSRMGFVSFASLYPQYNASNDTASRNSILPCLEQICKIFYIQQALYKVPPILNKSFVNLISIERCDQIWG